MAQNPNRNESSCMKTSPKFHNLKYISTWQLAMKINNQPSIRKVFRHFINLIAYNYFCILLWWLDLYYYYYLLEDIVLSRVFFFF
jgi:hypothetical protein